MASLYAAGWRQGSLFALDLEMVSWTVDSDARPMERRQKHQLWVLCTQDCDLDRAEVTLAEGILEIRPVFEDSGLNDWGIRSRRLRLTQSGFVECDSPRVTVSPSLLNSLSTPEEPIEERSRALKTWLGLRYDRPAVPEDFVEIAREVSRLCAARKDVIRDSVHDVLMRFDASVEGPRLEVFAVVTDDADKDAVRAWLAGAVVGVKKATIEQIEVATRDEVSLRFIEESYSADLSQITFKDQPPVGA